MPSRVDTATSDYATVLKPHLVSRGITVCRLHSGEYSLAAHDGDARVMIEMTEDEYRSFVEQLGGL